MSSQVDAVELSREIMYVLQERVRNSPDALPAGQLLAYGRDLAKLELARIAALPPAQEKKELSPAEILVAPGLPSERRFELLEKEKARLQSEIAEIDLLYEELRRTVASGIASAA